MNSIWWFVGITVVFCLLLWSFNRFVLPAPATPGEKLVSRVVNWTLWILMLLFDLNALTGFHPFGAWCR